MFFREPRLRLKTFRADILFQKIFVIIKINSFFKEKDNFLCVFFSWIDSILQVFRDNFCFVNFAYIYIFKFLIIIEIVSVWKKGGISMFSEEQKALLDIRINKLEFDFNYAKIAQINIAELMTAIKVAPSYKQLIQSQTDPNIFVTNYINERDYFGKRPYLNKNAILLYMYLHFINPSSSGQVRFSVNQASAFMQLPQKTIRGNLKILLTHGYIRYIKDDIKGIYIVYIDGYADKSKTVRDGFKGYVSLSFDTFKELLEQNKKSNINELRIKLRGLLQCVPGPNKERLNNISFSDFKKLLPSYVHIKDIKRLLATDNMMRLFNVGFSKNDAYCMVKVKDEYNPSIIKRDIVSNCDIKIRKLIKNMLSQKKYSSTTLLFTEKDYNDISKISLRLPVDDILNGVKSLFENYSNQNISSIGGLVRILSLESFDNRLLIHTPTQ